MHVEYVQMTDHVPASPPSKSEVEPFVIEKVAGVSDIECIWQYVENKVDPLQACF